MTRRPPTSTLFPYTTLFRSTRRLLDVRRQPDLTEQRLQASQYPVRQRRDVGSRAGVCLRAMIMPCYRVNPRSEEHTSELQSQSNLVCRLLLEKKKKKNVKMI